MTKIGKDIKSDYNEVGKTIRKYGRICRYSTKQGYFTLVMNSNVIKLGRINKLNLFPFSVYYLGGLEMEMN